MQVLIVNTSEKTGGAAIAAGRLLHALTSHGVKAKMMVRDKQTDHLQVVEAPQRRLNKLRFTLERGQIYMANGCTKEGLFDIDTGWRGVDITRTREFQEADVIHLHWVNQGFLSLRDVERILRSGKRVVWTMHDMWPATSICHYAADCTKYEQHCHDCMLLKSPAAKDLSYRIYEQKKRLYQYADRLSFVCCSHWLEEQALKSGLIGHLPITCIHNAIDAHVYKPLDKMQAREKMHLPKDKKLILFASLKVTDKRKGIDYMLEAARILHAQYPHLKDQLAFVVMGQKSDIIEEQIPFPVHSMGYITQTSDLVSIYQSADAFVIPSLFENLPNTIAEAMACGTPCVGFDTGGIPEMIVHQENGYVAQYRDSADLARGIDHVLAHSEYAAAAHSHALKAYDETHVAKAHIEVYASQ